MTARGWSRSTRAEVTTDDITPPATREFARKVSVEAEDREVNVVRVYVQDWERRGNGVVGLEIEVQCQHPEAVDHTAHSLDLAPLTAVQLDVLIDALTAARDKAIAAGILPKRRR